MKKYIFILVCFIVFPVISFASIDVNLKYGSKGDAVVELQDFLISKGFLSGQSTGNFYSLTNKAVIAYQTSVSLPQTGFVGPLTRAKINAELSSIVYTSNQGKITETRTTSNPVNTQTTQPKTFTLPNGTVIDANGNIISVSQNTVSSLQQQINTLNQQMVQQKNQTSQNTSQNNTQTTQPSQQTILPSVTTPPPTCSFSTRIVRKAISTRILDAVVSQGNWTVSPTNIPMTITDQNGKTLINQGSFQSRGWFDLDNVTLPTAPVPLLPDGTPNFASDGTATTTFTYTLTLTSGGVSTSCKDSTTVLPDVCTYADPIANHKIGTNGWTCTISPSIPFECQINGGLCPQQ